MTDTVLIENIEAMRRQQGIDDVELHDEIRGLVVGDVVWLTLLAGERAAETVPVRITAIAGPHFRGKLTARPTSTALATLRPGAALEFTADHIHSLQKTGEKNS
jgi:hypothetical protein